MSDRSQKAYSYSHIVRSLAASMQTGLISACIVGMDKDNIVITSRRVVLDRSKAHVYLDEEMLSYDDSGFFRISNPVGDAFQRGLRHMRVLLMDVSVVPDPAEVAMRYTSLVARQGLNSVRVPEGE